jgi:hypothetical protein
MSNLLNAGARDELRRRVAALRPDTPARWGKFDAPRMLAHAIQSLDMMTGALQVAPKPVPWVFRHAPLKHLLIYILPLPKGLPTAPELLARPSAAADGVSARSWEEECRAFDAALDRIANISARDAWPVHPVFGPLSGPQWGTQQYRHLDHHFRQFGL